MRRLGQKTRVTLIGTCAALVALIAIALAVGGSGSGSESGGTSRSATTSYSLHVPTNTGTKNAPLPEVAAGVAPLVPAGAPVADTAPEFARSAAGGGTSSGSSADAHSAKLTRTGSSLESSKIIKTGNLTIRVPKLAVKDVTQKLTALATAQGGYVSASNASLDSSNPYGEVVLRVPVAHFQDTIDAASRLGQKVVTLTTSADDVTGKYVDLSAKKHALERTRSTYLTILSRARTIGETLAVQQRIDDVQQQIDQLHGQLKLLGSQTSYSTLTVDVVPAGAQTLAAKHHQRDGIAKAWHDSWSRFDRGVNAIVGAIGPIVFALLLLGLLGLIGILGYRGFRRISERSHASA